MPDTAFTIAFVGGGNMAAALIAGLRRAGHSGDRIAVVEPVEVRRDHLIAQYGVRAQADAEGLQADLIVLDRNIFDIDPHDIHRAEVQLTMMNGRVVHEV